MREKPSFFDEMGHSSALRHVAAPTEASELPWSLLSAFNCPSDHWPPMALPTIISKTPEDALEQMEFISERWGISGAHVSIVAHDSFIDAEGALEAARLILDADFYPVLCAPLDWSVATRLSEMGCLAVDVRAIFKDYESVVSRPWLLERILADTACPVFLSGVFSPTAANLWLSKGASAIVHDLPEVSS